MGQLNNKVAVITGGAAGIGAATACLLAQEGARVVVADIGDAREVLGTISQAGGQAEACRLDVTSEDDWRGLMDHVATTYGRLDIMVANAGISLNVPLVDMSLADWRRQQAVNLEGVFLSVKYSIRAMREGDGGSIALLSSVAGLRGVPGLAGYSATKGGVRLLAKAAAMECAVAGYPIRVNSVHPGIIDTAIWAKAEVSAASGGANNATRLQPPTNIARTMVPLGRMGQPADVAQAILYLVSDASVYVTGTELLVDGGLMAGNMPRQDYM